MLHKPSILAIPTASYPTTGEKPSCSGGNYNPNVTMDAAAIMVGGTVIYTGAVFVTGAVIT